ncbi:MAG: hypothetical protein INR69_14845 [Mucilaginibacter polytrichastri]|nr:hypothetical protein [Mucilaginibacter polytrichastri]
MRTLLLTTATSLLALATIGQTKEKKSLINDSITVFRNYARNQSREGRFFVKTSSGNMLEKGSYKEDKPTGTWYFYRGKGKLESCYSYEQRKLLFLDSAMLNGISVNILSQDKTESENAAIPVLLCSSPLYLSIIAGNVRIPDTELTNDGLDVYVIAKIKADGTADYRLSYDKKNEKISKPFSLEKNADLVQWVPASYDGKNLTSEYIVSVHFNRGSMLHQNNKEFRRFRWDQ